MKAGIYLMILISFISCNKLQDYFPNPHPHQQPLPQFNKTYGGTSYEEPNAIAATNDGGYVLAASTQSADGDASGLHGNSDAWVVKLDENGGITWQKALGGSDFDLANTITTSCDDGYIMAGQTRSNDGDVSGNHGGYDAWVVKLDKNGNLLWQRAFGGTGTDVATAIIETKDKGFLMAGTSDSNNGDVSGNHGGEDVWLVKLDKDGNKIWQKTFGGTGVDEASSIIETPDGGYIMAGASNSNDGDVSGNHGYFDAWIVKLDKEGNLVWQKSVGGGALDAVFSIIASGDGGYLLAGDTNDENPDVVSNHGGSNAWVFKLDKDGNVLWQKAFGGSATDIAYSIVETKNHKFIIVGLTGSTDGDVSTNQGDDDAWLIKIDRNGNKVWQKTFGGSAPDHARSIITRTDGSYAITGRTYSTDGDVSGNHGDADVWVFTLKDAY